MDQSLLTRASLRSTADLSAEALVTRDGSAAMAGAGGRLGRRRTAAAGLLLLGIWGVVFFLSLFAPPLLDDADATHASAARAMLTMGDWVTLHVNGIRYLEKAPLPYWMVALSLRVFGMNTFAVHLPQALAVLLLALLGYRWGSRWYGDGTALYTGVGVLTAVGVFLFTRIFIPEVWLSLFLAAAFYSFLRCVVGAPLGGARSVIHPLLMWASVALAVLSKGLVALVFFFGATLVYLGVTSDWRRALRLRLGLGTLLFLAIAAPWHILAGLRNTGGANGHGFFWFYFINEHVLRFLGRRQPMDYNKLPASLYWSLHVVWLFPWSLFLPLVVLFGYRWLRGGSMPAGMTRTLLTRLRQASERERSSLLLVTMAGLILVFFSLSTNQEYYTFPAYVPLLLLTAAALTRAEEVFGRDRSARRLVLGAHAAFAALGAGIAVALGVGLWSSRHLSYVSDIGDVLAHRDVGNYTLSMSHFFDLTGPSFAALRLPAALAAAVFLVGPGTAWWLRQQRRQRSATMAIALTSAVFLVAAHLALVRFAPMLSSEAMARTIEGLRGSGKVGPGTEVLLYGDQAFGSSIPFYLGQRVLLVDGRSTSLLFGSTFADAPRIFLSSAELSREWGRGPRKLLFVPLEQRSTVDRLLGARALVVTEISGKALVTDRPLGAEIDRAARP